MRKTFYLMMMVLITSFSVQAYASDVFYVKSGGSDSNAGTEDAPWLTLNPDKWTDGCTVVILSDIYMGGEIDIPQIQDGAITNVTIKGSSAEIALMGLSDDEFDGGEEYLDFRFFRVDDDVVLNLENITLKNMRRIEDIGAGGIVTIGPFGTLNTNNVVFKNSEIIDVAGYGGAVNLEGKMNAKNTIFENCRVYQGGAVFIKETESVPNAIFEGCTFRNNSTDTGQNKLDYPQGGAIRIDIATGADLHFDKCYFDGNECINAKQGLAAGGAFYIQTLPQGSTLDFTIQNSTIANNRADGTGAFINIGKGTSPAEDIGNTMNIKLINNVIYANYSLTGSVAHGQCINFGGSYLPKLKGVLMFVNNTSVFNNHYTNAESPYFTNGMGETDIVFVNNIFIDNIFYGDDEFTGGWGFTFEESAGICKSYLTENNIYDGLGGSGIESVPNGFHASMKTNQTNINVGGNTTVPEKFEYVGLEKELTFPDNGVPYLALVNEYGIAVEGGINSANYNDENIVPAVDIRGAERVGTKDRGSFEYGGEAPGGIKDNFVSEKAYVYPNPFVDVLNLSGEAVSVKVYDMAGVCCLSAQNVSSVNTSGLVSGIYIVKIVDKTGITISQKVIK